MTALPLANRFVGIDVSKAHLDIRYLHKKRGSRIAYTPAALQELLEDLGDPTSVLVVMEATGGYERLCADTLANAGFAVAVVNPRQTRRFAGALGTLAKTDKIDAAMLAQYGEAIRPENRHKPDVERNALTSLMVRRRQLVLMAATERQRANPAHIDDHMRQSIKTHIAFLDEKIAEIATKIAELIAQHPSWHALSRAYQQVKGVGPELPSR